MSDNKEDNCEENPSNTNLMQAHQAAAMVNFYRNSEQFAFSNLNQQQPAWNAETPLANQNTMDFHQGTMNPMGSISNQQNLMGCDLTTMNPMGSITYPQNPIPMGFGQRTINPMGFGQRTMNPMGFGQRTMNPMGYIPNPMGQQYLASANQIPMPMNAESMLVLMQRQQMLNQIAYQNALVSAQIQSPTTAVGMPRRTSGKVKKSRRKLKPRPSSSSSSSSDCELDEPKRTKYGESIRSAGPRPAVDFAKRAAESEAKVGKVAPEAPNSSGVEPSTSSAVGKYSEQAQKFQQKRKHVWQEVAEQELVQETVNQMDVVTVVDKFIIERGSETYIVGNKRKRKRTDHQVDLSDNEGSGSFSSLSDGGISEDTNADLRKRIEAKRAAKSMSSMKKDALSVERTGKVKKVLTGVQILEEKLASFEDYKVPAYLARKLKEKNVELFVRAWRIFGKEFIIRLFRKTLKIERLGGIMIQDKSRRRTPGGVFLYLLRNDSRLEKDKREEVFRPLKEKILAEQKKVKALQKQNTFQGIAKRMNDGTGATTTTTKSQSEKTEEKFEFEEESYAIPVAMETTANVNQNPPVLPIKPQVSVRTASHPAGQELISYDDVCGFDWNADL